MSEHQEQMEPIIMLERMAKGQDATLYPEQRDAIKCLLNRVKELEQQRDAALKLADELEEEESNNYGYDSVHNGYTAAERIRAIYADKERP